MNAKSQDWIRPIETSSRIKQLAPWQWMNADAVFGITHPDTGEIGFISVMGALGEHLAVSVYLGASALARFFALQQAPQGVLDEHPELLLEIPQLQASFEDRGELEDWDRQLLRGLNLKFRGRKAWPRFQELSPGLHALAFGAGGNRISDDSPRTTRAGGAPVEGGSFFSVGRSTRYVVDSVMPGPEGKCGGVARPLRTRSTPKFPAGAAGMGARGREKTQTKATLLVKVSFVERDPRAYFRFAQLQSPRGRDLLAHHRLPADIRTIVLVEQGTVHVRSGAALRIARRLARPWRLAALFLVVPAFVRDAVYDWVARHRYAWFGRSDAGEMPSGAVRERLLDGGAGGAPASGGRAGGTRAGDGDAGRDEAAYPRT